MGTVGMTSPLSPLGGGPFIIYNIVLEPTESVGVSLTNANTAYLPNHRPFGEWVENSALNPLGANTWTSTTQITGVISNDFGFAASVSSLVVAPGTIIDLNVVHNGTVGVEQVSRPLCQITPRDCRPSHSTGTAVTLTVDSNLPLRAVTLLVNGAALPGLPGFHVSPNPATYAAGTNTWVIPANVLGMVSGQQYLLRLEAIEAAPPGFVLSLAKGVNEVVY